MVSLNMQSSQNKLSWENWESKPINLICFERMGSAIVSAYRLGATLDDENHPKHAILKSADLLISIFKLFTGIKYLCGFNYELINYELRTHVKGFRISYKRFVTDNS